MDWHTTCVQTDMYMYMYTTKTHYIYTWNSIIHTYYDDGYITGHDVDGHHQD